MLKKFLLFAITTTIIYAAPNAPANLRLTPTNFSVLLQWEDRSDNESGFKIFRDGLLVATLPPNATSYTDSVLKPNTKYTYTVKATDDEINHGGYFPTGDELIFPNKIYATNQDWCDKIKEAPDHSTIILADGIYGENSDDCAIKNKRYITIKAATKWGVKYRGNAYFIQANDNNAYINILGIDVKTPEENYDSGLLCAHGYEYYNHHIYVADCWVHNSGNAIMTGPTTHDVTVDRCFINDIKTNYYWYGMGWHLVLANSVLFHPENDGMMCRGHYPINRRWRYRDRSVEADVRKDLNITNIPEDEWTHMIVNNTFGSGYGRVAKREWSRGSAIAFYIGWNDDIEEKKYLPPQNVLIANNIFYDITPSYNEEYNITIPGAISIKKDFGFPDVMPDENDTNRVAVIKGTVIKNNISDGKILKEFNNPNISLIEMASNIENLGQRELNLTDPLHFNFSPVPDLNLTTDKGEFIEGVDQSVDILYRERLNLPDIGAYEGSADNNDTNASLQDWIYNE